MRVMCGMREGFLGEIGAAKADSGLGIGMIGAFSAGGIYGLRACLLESVSRYCCFGGKELKGSIWD